MIVLIIAYSFSSTYQQTITITLPFNNTYKYIPNLLSQGNNSKQQLDKITVVVTGSIKKNKNNINNSVISPSNSIKELLQKNIVDKYENSMLIHETSLFNSPRDDNLRLISIDKQPSLENLLILFFNNINKTTSLIGCKLISVKLTSGETKITHSIYKITNYKL